MSSPSKNQTQSHGAPAPAPAPGPSNEQIALYMNIAIWGIVALLAVVNIPRAWARYRHPTARRSTLRFKTASKKARQAPPRHGVQVQRSDSTAANSVRHDDLSPIKDKGESYAFEFSPTSPIEDGSVPATTHSSSVPARVHSLGARFHRANRYLHRPFLNTGYTIGQSIAFTVYSIFIVFGCFYRNFVPTFMPRRAGAIAVGQFPLIFALGAKNNIVGFLLGVGYEKLNVWHRWVGKMIFFAGLAHVVGWLVRWTVSGKLVMGTAAHPEGWAMFGGLCFLAIISLPPIRKSYYRIFWHAHWIGYLSFIIGLGFHFDEGWKWSVVAGAMLVFDHICRLFKTTFVYATITAIPELGCTRIEVPHLTRGWRAGQHVRLRTISSLMGPLDALEAHPFTIATVSESDGGEGLTLYAKNAGDWTNRLYEAAKGTQRELEAGSTEKGLRTAPEQSTKMRMVLEGPYGGPGHDVFSSFSSALIIAGGSGITFGLSSVDEIIREAEAGLAKTRLVKFVWIIQDPACLVHMMLVLQTIINRAARLRNLKVNIDIFYTRAIPSSMAQTLENASNLPENVTLSPGRPKLGNLLEGFIDKTKELEENSNNLHGTVVGCCGPASLGESVKRATMSISGSKRLAVGGVELVEELFGW